jgi:hypothetical protein
MRKCDVRQPLRAPTCVGLTDCVRVVCARWPVDNRMSRVKHNVTSMRSSCRPLEEMPQVRSRESCFRDCVCGRSGGLSRAVSQPYENDRLVVVQHRRGQEVT